MSDATTTQELRDERLLRPWEFAGFHWYSHALNVELYGFSCPGRPSANQMIIRHERFCRDLISALECGNPVNVVAFDDAKKMNQCGFESRYSFDFPVIRNGDWVWKAVQNVG